MANASFGKFRRDLMLAVHNLDTADIRVLLLNGYDFDVAHEFVSSVLAEAGTTEVARSGAAIATTTVSDLGVFDGDDVLFAGLTGSAVQDIVLFNQAGGADSARKALVHIDTGTGIPYTPSGADWTLRWNASGIVVLG